jgi:hypothetical protein
MVKVKLLEGPSKGTVNKFRFDNLAKIVKRAGQAASLAAATTGAAAVASPLAAAFSASAGAAATGSKDKHVDSEKDLGALLEDKEAAERFASSAPCHSFDDRTYVAKSYRAGGRKMCERSTTLQHRARPRSTALPPQQLARRR